jgi:hypothetical protein
LFDPEKNSLSDLFELVEEFTTKVFCVSALRFLELQASDSYVPVPGNNWAQCASTFHTIAAFYRLSITPQLSPALFASDDLYQELCQRFCETYRVSPPVDVALGQLFSMLVFAFDLLGFAVTTNLAENNSIDAAQSLANGPQTNRFAFSEIAFVIARFNRETFPDRTAPDDVLDYEGYSYLRNVIEFVRSALSTMNLIRDDLNPRKALSEAVIQFQVANGLPTGPCNSFTLRQIWCAAMAPGCDFPALCQLSGVNTAQSDFPVFERKLAKIDVAKGPDQQPIEMVINYILGDVLSHSEAPDWMIRQAEKSVETQLDKLEEAARAARQIGDKVAALEQKLNQTAGENAAAVTKFQETAQLLEEIGTEQEGMQRAFSQVKKRMQEDRDGNHILFVVVIVLAVVFLFRFFSG